MSDVALEYVAARQVLLDALQALGSHRRAVIVAGAQAVYLHTGTGDLAIAPYTTDGDLALDPDLLDDQPDLEATMTGAGFELWAPTGTHPEPGIWVGVATVGDQELAVRIDLIVPEGHAALGGRRGARLGPHGRRAARRVPGMEATLVDHGRQTVAALAPADPRSFDVEVAGVAALFVAKAHKIHDRLADPGRVRLVDKDAADIYRLMQHTTPRDLAPTLTRLRGHDVAGPVTEAALDHLGTLFARRGAPGVEMAVRALRLAIPDPQVRALCTSYMAQLRELLA